MPTLEDFVNAHVLIQLEMQERGIRHPDFDDELDRNAEWIVEEYDVPTGEPETPILSERLREERPRVTLEEFLSWLPNTFSVDSPPYDIIVAGSIVNRGYSPEGHDIDIFILSDEVDRRVIASFLRSLPKEVRDIAKRKCVFHFDPEGGTVGYFIPLYRKAYQRVEVSS